MKRKEPALAAVEFQDVSKVYPDGTRAVDSLEPRPLFSLETRHR